jgi:hypothetical protein
MMPPLQARERLTCGGQTKLEPILKIESESILTQNVAPRLSARQQQSATLKQQFASKPTAITDT